MICAIVPAAGLSRRMGTQKLLLPWAGTTVVGHIVDELVLSAIGRIIVVVGHQGPLVTAELADRPVHVVENPDYRSGMLSSVRCGLAALPHQCAAALVALGDQPAVSSTLVDRMIRAFDSTKKGLVVPVRDGKRGHPLLIAVRYFDEILTRYDDVGLRGLARAHGDDVLELATASDDVLWDIDTPEDYQRRSAGRRSQ